MGKLILVSFLSFNLCSHDLLLPYAGPRIITIDAKGNLYCGSNIRGYCIYKSTDFGFSWQLLFSQCPTGGPFGDLWVTKKGVIFGSSCFGYGGPFGLWRLEPKTKLPDRFDTYKFDVKLTFRDEEEGMYNVGIRDFAEDIDGTLYFSVMPLTGIVRVYKSIDDGKSWKRILLIKNAQNWYYRKSRCLLLTSSKKSGILIVGLNERPHRTGVFYFSKDYGESWPIKKHLPGGVISMDWGREEDEIVIVGNGIWLLRNINFKNPEKMYFLHLFSGSGYGPFNPLGYSGARHNWEVGTSKFGNIYATFTRVVIALIDNGRLVVPLFHRLWGSGSENQRPFEIDKKNGFIYIGHNATVVSSFGGISYSGGRMIRIEDKPADKWPKPKFKYYTLCDSYVFKDTMKFYNSREGSFKRIADIRSYKKHILVVTNSQTIPIELEIIVSETFPEKKPKIVFSQKFEVGAKSTKRYKFKASGYAYIKAKASGKPKKLKNLGYFRALLVSY